MSLAPATSPTAEEASERIAPGTYQPLIIVANATDEEVKSRSEQKISRVLSG